MRSSAQLGLSVSASAVSTMCGQTQLQRMPYDPYSTAIDARGPAHREASKAG